MTRTAKTRSHPGRPLVLNVLIAAIPFAVVVLALTSMARGLLAFLRGDESLVPVLLAIVVPILVVPVGLLVQMLLVRFVSPRGTVEEDHADDGSSFL